MSKLSVEEIKKLVGYCNVRSQKEFEMACWCQTVLHAYDFQGELLKTANVERGALQELLGKEHKRGLHMAEKLARRPLNVEDMQRRVDKATKDRDTWESRHHTADRTATALSKEVAQLHLDYNNACKTIADMHAAAVGEVTGPYRGVVEDVADTNEHLAAVVSECQAQERAIIKRNSQIQELKSEVSALKQKYDGVHHDGVFLRARRDELGATVDRLTLINKAICQDRDDRLTSMDNERNEQLSRKHDALGVVESERNAAEKDRDTWKCRADTAINAGIRHLTEDEFQELKRLMVDSKADELLGLLVGKHHPTCNSTFLEWVADRLVQKHGEPENVDFVLSLRKRAEEFRAAAIKYGK